MIKEYPLAVLLYHILSDLTYISLSDNGQDPCIRMVRGIGWKSRTVTPL